jgi:hypothetical protein
MSDDLLRCGVFDFERLAALGLDPFAADQHAVLFGQERLRGFAELRFGDSDVHEVLPDGHWKSLYLIEYTAAALPSSVPQEESKVGFTPATNRRRQSRPPQRRRSRPE